MSAQGRLALALGAALLLLAPSGARAQDAMELEGDEESVPALVLVPAATAVGSGAALLALYYPRPSFGTADSWLLLLGAPLTAGGWLGLALVIEAIAGVPERDRNIATGIASWIAGTLLALVAGLATLDPGGALGTGPERTVRAATLAYVGGWAMALGSAMVLDTALHHE